MGCCISRPSVQHDTHHSYGYTQDAESTAAESRQSSPGSESQWQQFPKSPRRAASGSTSWPSPSVRVTEKLQLLTQALQRARRAEISPALVQYGQHIANDLANNVQPNEDTLSLDIDNFPRLAGGYNSRYPGLNLSHMDSPAAFLNALADCSSDISWRAVVRLEDGGKHHFVADVRTRAGEPPSVIVMEAASLYTFVTAYTNLRRQSLQRLGPEPKWAFIGVGAQKSEADCVMFGMNFALAAHHRSSTFDDWHENLHQHGTIADKGNDSGQFMPSPDAMLEFAQINLFHGEQFLPALFYKHSHSKGVVDEVADHQSGIKDKDMSSSRRAQKSESLSERLDAFAVHREGKKPYSASIETSRATKIRTALDKMLYD